LHFKALEIGELEARILALEERIAGMKPQRIA
jgi:hypothetical protein